MTKPSMLPSSTPLFSISPMPVEKFPNEFVAHLQRYDRSPAMGYFFSAYPEIEVAAIQRMGDDRS